MPAAIEPPKPAQTPPIAKIAMAGKSPADVFADSGGKTPDVQPAAPPDFNSALAAAQAKDKGVPAPPAPKEPAAPAEPAATPKVPGLPAAEPVEQWTPKGQVAKHFDALKAKHAEESAGYKAQLDALKAELAQAKSTGTPADIEAAKKELAEYKAILKDVAIERDPEFKQAYATREKAALDAAKMAAGDNADKLSKLLEYPSSPWRDEQINKLVDGLSASAQRRVNAALQVMEQIDVERSSEIARRRATFEQKVALTEAQRKENDAQMQKAMETEFEAVHKEWTDTTNGHPFFTEREGDKEHNARVAEARALSKAIFQGQLSPKELATAAHWAATGPMALEGWRAALKRAEAAEAKLDAMRGVSPGDGRQDGLEPGEAKEAPKPGTVEYLRYMDRQLKQAQAKDFATKRGIK